MCSLQAAAAAAAGVAELEARAAQLRAALAAHPSSFEASLELASTLHQLDHSAPNGGKRVPEAAAAYRRAAELAPQPAARAAVLSNLAALLLAGGRVSLRAHGEEMVAVHEWGCCSKLDGGSPEIRLQAAARAQGRRLHSFGPLQLTSVPTPAGGGGSGSHEHNPSAGPGAGHGARRAGGCLNLHNVERYVCWWWLTRAMVAGEAPSAVDVLLGVDSKQALPAANPVWSCGATCRSPQLEWNHPFLIHSILFGAVRGHAVQPGQSGAAARAAGGGAGAAARRAATVQGRGRSASFAALWGPFVHQLLVLLRRCAGLRTRQVQLLLPLFSLVLAVTLRCRACRCRSAA